MDWGTDKRLVGLAEDSLEELKQLADTAGAVSSEPFYSTSC